MGPAMTAAQSRFPKNQRGKIGVVLENDALER